MLESLNRQRVLVIGGSSGIGEAAALMAAKAGALVTIASRSSQKRATALARLPEGVLATALDVCDGDAVDAFFKRHEAWDHVVLAGSSTKVGTIQGLSLEDAQAAMQNKFWGAYHVGRSARIQAGGSLTFVSGVFAQRPVTGAILQGAINGALESLMRGLALAMAPAVRVNAVSPSTTATPLWDRLGEAGRAAKFAEMAAKLPVGKVAQPEDIARAIWFVATSPFSTGSTVLVDGGDALV
jgi:NAD(P)-dependent dehydrogenase (short-subunit alcohol dehydrogenase family)